MSKLKETVYAIEDNKGEVIQGTLNANQWRAWGVAIDQQANRLKGGES